MAAMLGGGGDGAIGGGGLPLESWFFEMPIITRWWTTATALAGVLVQCQVLTPFQLFYSYRAVFHKGQVNMPLSHTSLYNARADYGKTTVLATPLHIRLLRPALPQPPLSHLLHPTIRAHVGGERGERGTL